MNDSRNESAGLGADWNGIADSECGEHRTTGLRAWCFACSTWCYPEDPCPGCDQPRLRAEIERLEAELLAAREVIRAARDFLPQRTTSGGINREDWDDLETTLGDYDRLTKSDSKETP